MKKTTLTIGLLLIILIPIYSQYYGDSNQTSTSTIVLIAIWVLSSFVVAAFAGGRKIGFGETLAISLLLSPLVGAICMATSKKDDEWRLQVEMHDLLKQIQITLAPKPQAVEKVIEIDDNTDFMKLPIVQREELMEKYGIKFNAWNEKYKYKDKAFSNFNDAIRYAIKEENS